MKRVMVAAALALQLGGAFSCGTTTPAVADDAKAQREPMEPLKQSLVDVMGQVTSTGSTPLHGPLAVAVTWRRLEDFGEQPPGTMEPGAPGGPTPTISDGGTSYLYPSAPFPAAESLPCMSPQAGETPPQVSPAPAAVSSPGVALTGQAPEGFTLPITELPDPGVRADLGELGGTGTLTKGVLIVFEDLNANGRHDYGNQSQAPERIVATSMHVTAGGLDEYSLMYLDGTLPPAGLAGVPAQLPTGFSLVRTTLNFGGTLAAVSVPLSTTVPVQPSEGPVDATFLLGCTSWQFSSRVVLESPPPTAQVQCLFPGANQYNWSTTNISGCSIAFTSGYQCVPAGQSRPSNWPCDH